MARCCRQQIWARYWDRRRSHRLQARVLAHGCRIFRCRHAEALLAHSLRRQGNALSYLPSNEWRRGAARQYPPLSYLSGAASRGLRVSVGANLALSSPAWQRREEVVKRRSLHLRIGRLCGWSCRSSSYRTIPLRQEECNFCFTHMSSNNYIHGARAQLFSFRVAGGARKKLPVKRADGLWSCPPVFLLG